MRRKKNKKQKGGKLSWFNPGPFSSSINKYNFKKIKRRSQKKGFLRRQKGGIFLIDPF